MSFNKDHFENKDIWDNYSQFQKIINKEKYTYIKETININTSSILDIGCGNGNMLKSFYSNCENLYGADFSYTALKEIKSFANTIYLDLENPTFEDFSKYDIVMTCDVLEHLQNNALENAIKLIKQVSKKYIIVNVPNSEDLELRRSKCNSCHTIFHPYGHIGSFDVKRIIKLFTTEKIKYLASGTIGPVKPYNNFYLSNISKCVLNTYMFIETANCPACNKSDLKQNRNKLSKVSNLLNKLIGFTKNREKEELIVIFEVL